ncbi:MAG TPA: secretin N-terminal domain-containing protein [Trueperaceae bacterium]|nr:secretin N-terminal domain-containing protein [Trueperaceae bacterium]
MKRFSVVLTFLALIAVALAQGKLAPLPDDPRFDEPVEFITGVTGESLPAMISGLAQSIGLTAITDDVPPVTIVYDIGEAKPFRQVWNIVLTLNDLDYVLLENDVVVVGTPDSVARLRAPTAPVADTTAAAAAQPEPLEQRFYRVNSDPAQVVQILDRAVAGIDVEALPGVNSIVVLGTQAQHDQVAAVLEQFDRAVEEVSLEQRTYFLSNAKAEELAAVLQATGVLAGGSEEQAAGRLEDFSVVAEPRTNSLIVTGPAAVQARLADLIPELDQPQRQVNVQVRIQEVSHSFTQDFGLDLSGGFGQMSASILETGLSFIFDTASAVSSFNILAVLDALESQGLSRRVDDGNLTMLDKQTGTLTSGGTVRFILPNAAGEAELVPVDYGVTLEITPLIGADGRITLSIHAEVTDLLPTPPEAVLHTSTRDVSTTLSLQPGQTVLLAGLLQDEIVVTKRRVPILGAIPIIGELFGTTSTEEESGELLLVITAQVIE